MLEEEEGEWWMRGGESKRRGEEGGIGGERRWRGMGPRGKKERERVSE